MIGICFTDAHRDMLYRRLESVVFTLMQTADSGLYDAALMSVLGTSKKRKAPAKGARGKKKGKAAKKADQEEEEEEEEDGEEAEDGDQEDEEEEGDEEGMSPDHQEEEEEECELDSDEEDCTNLPSMHFHPFPVM